MRDPQFLLLMESNKDNVSELTPFPNKNLPRAEIFSVEVIFRKDGDQTNTIDEDRIAGRQRGTNINN